MGGAMQKMALVVALGACLALLIPVCSAAVSHTVGDSIGWTLPSSTSFYSSWASKESSVNVGDFLVFNFMGATQTVAEVTKSAYDSCSAVSPITQMNNGPVNITITSPGPHYYISTDSGHCDAGQKFSITAASSTATTPPTAPAPKSSTPSTPSGAKTPAASTPTATPAGKGAMSPSTTTTPTTPSGAKTPAASTPMSTPTGKGAMSPSTTTPSGAMTPGTSPVSAPGSSTSMSPATTPIASPGSPAMSPAGAPSSSISTAPASRPSADAGAPESSMGAPTGSAESPMSSGGPAASSSDGGMITPAKEPSPSNSATAAGAAALILPLFLVVATNFLF